MQIKKYDIIKKDYYYIFCITEGRDKMENKRRETGKAALILCLIITLIVCMGLSACTTGASKELPKPEITGGARGELGIDKNINEATIDEYLGRPNAVYRDMRMLEDPAQYENIGGDRFLSGYVDGFEIVPLPYIIPVDGLPGAVGEPYSGDTLFGGSNGWVYYPNYEESMSIIEELFPKDKEIFLMCGGGGYAGMMKTFLVSMGWDPDKIYVVGGYWFYDGEHKVDVPKKEDGTTYDFSGVPYHDIDFSKLTKAPEYEEDESVAVTGVWLNAEKIEVEEDMSFQIGSVVLPNDAYNKNLNWTSSDETIAVMDGYGQIRGLKPGTVTITAETEDGGFTATCEVTVTQKEEAEHVTLSDVSEEFDTFTKNDPNAIMHRLDFLDEDYDKAVEEGYYEKDGEGYVPTDLWHKTYEKNTEEAEKAVAVRTEVLNKLVRDKKTFILLVYTKDCEGRDYHAAEGAVNVLKEAGLPYFYTNDMVSEYDTSLYKSLIDYNKVTASSIAIFKDGELYAGLNPDLYSMKSDDDVKAWFAKYIDLE